MLLHISCPSIMDPCEWCDLELWPFDVKTCPRNTHDMKKPCRQFWAF